MDEVVTRHKRSRERSASVESSVSITEDEKQPKVDYFPATKLFEYQWPLGNEGAEFFMLQEQVKEYLDIRGIQRKYPDLTRRNLDLDERKYLVGRGVVTETQSNMATPTGRLACETTGQHGHTHWTSGLRDYRATWPHPLDVWPARLQGNMGLVALRSEEVLELMAAEYAGKYGEYQVVLQEREFQATLRRKMMESKRVAFLAESQLSMGTSHVTDKAMNSVVSFNSRLAESRRAARKEYLDTQTKLTHVPRRTPVVCPAPKMSRYPVALLPGQYSDYVRPLTPAQLNELPLNTILSTPEVEQPVVEKQPELIDNSPSTNLLKSLFSIPNASGSGINQISAANSILSAILSKSVLAKPPSIPKPASGTGMGQVPVTSFVTASLPVVTNVRAPTVASPVLKPISSVVGTGIEQKKDTNLESKNKNEIVDVIGTKEQNPKLGLESSLMETSVLETSEVKGQTSGEEQQVTLGEDMEMMTPESDKVKGQTVDASVLVEKKQQPAYQIVSVSSGAAVVGSTGDPVVRKEGVGLSKVLATLRRKQAKTALCRVCYKSSASNKLGVAEEMIMCSDCKSYIHPSCYDLNTKSLGLLHSYKWQCLDCKTCQLCTASDKDEQMMCCEECDRGYHYFCVGLSEVPSGRWLCAQCGRCASCGRTAPGPAPPGDRGKGSENTEGWKYKYHKGKFLQTLCQECSSYFGRGYFCPVCLRIYHDDETDSPMVCCDSCDRWIHTECDGISEERYRELSQEDKSVYVCCLCRGEAVEKVDTHHKKYRTN